MKRIIKERVRDLNSRCDQEPENPLGSGRASYSVPNETENYQVVSRGSGFELRNKSDGRFLSCMAIMVGRSVSAEMNDRRMGQDCQDGNAPSGSKKRKGQTDDPCKSKKTVKSFERSEDGNYETVDSSVVAGHKNSNSVGESDEEVEIVYCSLQKSKDQSTQSNENNLGDLLRLHRKVADLTSENKNLRLKTEELDEQIQKLKRENGVIAREEWSKKLTSIMETELACAICSEIVIQPVTGSCGHLFCALCITKWFREGQARQSCPTCRKPWGWDQGELKPVEGLINQLYQLLSAEAVGSRDEVLKERGRERAAEIEQNHRTINVEIESPDRQRIAEIVQNQPRDAHVELLIRQRAARMDGLFQELPERAMGRGRGSGLDVRSALRSTTTQRSEITIGIVDSPNDAPSSSSAQRTPNPDVSSTDDDSDDHESVSSGRLSTRAVYEYNPGANGVRTQARNGPNSIRLDSSDYEEDWESELEVVSLV